MSTNMKQSTFSHLFILLSVVTLGSCWKFFPSIVEYTLLKNIPDTESVHTDYNFGDCNNKYKKFYTSAHVSHNEVSGKVIVRGWLNIKRIPTCIILRGLSYETDWFRSTAYSFQMCVPRISYCYAMRRWNYYYYEWYIPPDMVGVNMNWDLYFYGPKSEDWT